MAALTKGVAPAIVSTMSGKVVKQLPPFKEWRMLSVANPKPELRNLKRLDNFLSYFRSFGEKNLRSRNHRRRSEACNQGKS